MKKKNILAVDDMPPILSMIRYLLRDEFQVFPANSVKDALALLERSDMQIDLVLLDLEMPVTSGFQLLKEIKNTPKWRHLPVIMLTGNADSDSVIRAAQAGAMSYIVKPFTEEVLKQKVRAALK
jgi:DNA-binding response OmpR family regulator